MEPCDVRKLWKREMRVMRRNLFYALASRRADVWEKRVRTNSQGRRIFMFLKSSVMKRGSYFHQNKKIFGSRKEKFWGAVSYLTKINWENEEGIGVEPRWNSGGIKRHFPSDSVSVLATQEFSHSYKHESFRCCKYLFIVIFLLFALSHHSIFNGWS